MKFAPLCPAEAAALGVPARSGGPFTTIAVARRSPPSLKHDIDANLRSLLRNARHARVLSLALKIALR